MIEDIDQDVNISWNKIASELKKSLDKDTFQNWIKPINFETQLDNSLTLSVPTRFLRDWIIKNYAPVIKRAYLDQGVTVDKLSIIVKENNNRIIPGTEVVYQDNEDDEDTYYDDISAPLDPQFTFDNFIVGKPNELAYAAAQRVAQSEVVSFNPLFLYGGVGLGKTHLMHAVAWSIKKRSPKKNVVYLTAEKFMYQFIKALRFKNIMSFKEQFRSVDVLMIDDVQFIIGKDNTQEEFFHTFNSLHGAGRQVVLSSDRPPRNIATLEDRLRSRFEWGLITDIQPPDIETRLAILRKKTESQQTNVPDDVLEFIASLITNNIRELEGALIRVSAYASLTQEPLTGDLAKRVLGDIGSGRDSRPITPGVIMDATSEMFGYDLEELKGKRRHRSLVQARQISMYVVRELTDLSYPAIAREFGGRDHTTVMHAVEKVGKQMAERRQVYDQVSALISDIKSNRP